MDTIGATILKQLQALSSRANTLLQRIKHDAITSARELEREAREAERDLRGIAEKSDHDEAQWMAQAEQALAELA